MIWLALVALVLVAGGAWVAASRLQTRAIIAAVGAAAVAAYWTLGRPAFTDQPLDARIAELQAVQQTAPDKITPVQYLALLEDAARRRPDDPAPHKQIGDLYAANDKFDQALIAYQAALRRDPGYVPAQDALAELRFLNSGEVDDGTRANLPAIKQRAQSDPQSLTNVQLLALIEDRIKAQPDDATAYRMMGEIYASVGKLDKADAAYRSALAQAPNDREIVKAWADARFKASGTVDKATSDLYAQAYRLNPADLRIGYLSGIGLWLQGKRPEATALLTKIDAQAPAEGPQRQMFAALRQMFKIDLSRADGRDPAPAAASPSPSGRPKPSNK